MITIATPLPQRIVRLYNGFVALVDRGQPLFGLVVRVYVTLVYGPGRISADHWLRRRAAD